MSSGETARRARRPPLGSPRRGAPVEALARPPRLGVGHLLLWLTASAVSLAALRATAGSIDLGAYGALLAAAQSAAYGAVWAGAAVAVFRIVRGGPWPIEPGHWLLLALGGKLAVAVALEVARPSAIEHPAYLAAAAGRLLLLPPLLSRKAPGAWKCAIAGLLLVALWPVARFALGGAIERWIASGAPWWTLFATVLLLSLGMAGDWRDGARRYWPHWLGVTSWTLSAASAAAPF